MFDIDSSTGEITVAQSLDREEEDQYIVVVMATDNDEDSPLETNVSITIDVSDVNDNSPKFPSTPTSFRISETLKVGDYVVKIVATDADEEGTANSEITYNITGGSGAEYFDIDPSSGNLTVALTLDYETNTSFELVIEATDGGFPTLSSNMTYTIRLRNEDDNDPMFEQDSYEFMIQENNQINNFIGQVKATDLDPHNRTIGYDFTETETLFMINRTTGNITASRVYDLESMSEFTHEVQVEVFYNDEISFARDTVLVYITITDEDEFDIIVEEIDNIEIYENANVGDVVRMIEASDRDANSFLQYSLSISDNLLEVNSTTGNISIAKEIDRESSVLDDTCPSGTPDDASCTRFNVRITDETSSDIVRRSLYLVVRDLDDEPPEFSESTYYYANLSENTEVGFELTDLQLSASDPDIGVSLTYEIPSDQGIEDFSIEMLVARIDVAETLDYEQSATYNFTITATDTEGNVGSATVVIDIFDENDNTPEFVQSIYTQTVIEDSDPGLEVITVNATDADSTSNAELAYRITDGNIGNKFEIDSETGLVTLEASIDRENVSFYSLTIEAVDGGEVPLTGSVLLNITISDVDDHPPFFLRSEYVGEVSESATSGDDVLDRDGNPFQVTVEDLDEGASVTITSYGFGVPFDIDENTGYVTVSGTLNAEIEHEYQFVVIARDNTGLPSVPATVTITVIDENEHRPVFEEASYELTLEENSSEGEVILEVVAIDEDSRDIITYSIQTSFNASVVELPEVASGDISSGEEIKELTFPFEIDNSTGDITLLRRLDYETVPQWVFNVTATDRESEKSVVSVTINVEDLNDNPPRFVNHTFEIFIHEDAAVSDSEPVSDLIRAEDQDSVSQGNLQYYILSGAEGTFEMDRLTGNIFLTKELDINDVDSYELEVIVSDGEEDDTAIVEIIVVDVNNHRPVFREDPFTFSFLENSTNGTLVGQVVADDDDFDELGSVTYSIIGGDADIFLIDNSTGEIFTIASDFDADEPPYSYEITVEATDGGMPPMSSNVSVEITLEDVNDNDPEFTLPRFQFSVAEDTEVDMSVFRITAMDADSGTNEEMEFQILTQNASFSIDLETGIIRVAGELDFDDSSLPIPIFIEISVTDTGSPPRSSNGVLNITITDVNDNAPYFTNDLIQAFVAENTTVNETAFIVEAFDRDSNENAQLSYEILDAVPAECRTRYRIVGNTGEVILNEPVDAEQREQTCSLLIQATDNGDPQLSNTATFNVLITDINEEAPEFVPARPIGEIAENSVNGTSVLTLQTTDGDGDFVRYRAIGGATRTFDVSTSGLISVARGAVLDREAKSDYELLVEARDDGSPRMSTQTTVTITIADENDNSPIFSEANYYVSVRESLGLNEAFGTIVASDADIGTNDDIQYTLIDNGKGETDFGKFAIQPESGQLFLIEELDFETEDRYYLLKVQADDDVFQTETFVHIRVLESNDITPTFDNLPGSTELAEDAKKGTFVFEVSATDNDLNVNGKITYSLMETEGSEKFTINPETGVVTVSGDNLFDFDEGEQTYELTVVAMDNAGSVASGENEAVSGSAFGNEMLVTSDDKVLTNTSTLTVYITDVNDNAPMFLEDSYNPVVIEHDGISLTVITVTATDADEPGNPNSEINYEIISGSFGRFEIQPNGDITSVPPINRDVVQVYNMVVIAYDSGEPSLNTTVSVTVTVHDSNDQRPVFTQTRYTGSVLENSPEGVSVLEVRAFDRNTIESPANYSLQESDVSDYFTINSTTGVIATSDLVIDRETIQDFTLVAQAGDSTSDFSTATVFIRVTDENDQRPVFEELEYSFTVGENQAVGTRLSGIKAVDADVGSNAETIYELVFESGSNGLFGIDSENGDIIVENLPCFSDSSNETHTFTVHATDSLDSSLSNTSFLTISLFEQNNHPPVFEQPSYVSRLESLAPEGTEVLPSIHTTDRDVCSGEPIFEIDDGNVNDTFTINSTTGRIVLARNLTEEDLSFTLSVRASDTGNFEVPDLEATVSIVVLVGQLLPVSVAVEPGLTTLLISRLTQFRYVQGIWLPDGGGSPTNSAPNVTFSLGSVAEETQIPVVGTTATTVAAALAREDVYPDEPEILVGVQVEGPNHGRASVEPTQVFIRVATESDSDATSSCTTTQGSGSCVATVTVPLAWFGSGSSNVSVYYGLSEPADTLLGQVRINAVESCTFSSPAVSVQMPAKVIFQGQTFNINVYPHLDNSISDFHFTFTIDEGLEFVEINWTPSDYNIQYATHENKLTVTGTYTGETGSSTDRILGLEFQLNSNGSLSEGNVMNIHCNVDYLVTDNGEEVITNTSAYHINFDEDGSCNSVTGEVLVASPTLVQLFPYTSTTGLLNTAYLTGEQVSIDIVGHGLLSSGELTDSLSNLECESSDESIIKVSEDCQFVYLTGNETSGSESVDVTVRTAQLSSMLTFQVWFPTDVDITFGTTDLSSVQRVYNADCTTTYERTSVTVQAVFESGSERQVATVTPQVAQHLLSTDEDVITIDVDYTSGEVWAVGAGAGEAYVTLEVNDTTFSSSESIRVSGLSVLVEDISFSFHTGLSPLLLPQATAGESYLETAQVELLTNPEYLNQPISVLAEARLNNGQYLMLSDENGLILETTDEEVIEVSSWQEIYVRGGGSGLFLRGRLDTERCPDVLVPLDDVFSARVEINFQPISHVSVSISDMTLVTPEYASLLNLTTSTTILAYLVHEDGTSVDITDDSRTSFSSTGEQISISSTGTLTSTDSYGLTNITVTYTYNGIDYETDDSIEVVGISSIEVSASPYPAYSGSDAVSLTTLSQYPVINETVYQKAQLSARAVFSNGESVDITNHVSFSVSNDSILELNGTKVEGLIPGNATVSAELGDLENDLSFVLTDSVLDIASISEFSVDVRSDDVLLAGQIGSEVLPSLTLEFSDGTFYPSFLTPSGPAVEGLVSFTTSDPIELPINSETGIIEVTGNTVFSSNQFITAQVVSEPSITSQITISEVDVEAGFGDADVEVVANYPLSVDDIVTVKLYINAEEASLGAVELRLRYNSSHLSLDDELDMGADVPDGSIFESFSGFADGEVTVAFITPEDTLGSERIHIATAMFRVKEMEDLEYSVDVVLLNTYSPTLDTIGDPVPRQSDSASVNSEVETQTEPTRCSEPPCSPSDCEDLGVVAPLGDVNADCVLDPLDVLALQMYATRATLDPDYFSDSQLEAMDADKNGRIDLQDAKFLLSASLGRYPLIADPVLRPIDAEFSDCMLSINITLDDAFSDTFVFFGLFHRNMFFRDQYDATDFAVGTKTDSMVPDGSYGGWSEPMSYGGGVYGIVTEPGTISQTDISFVVIYGVLALDGTVQDNRHVLLTGPPSLPFSHEEFTSSFEIFGTPTTLTSGGPFNGFVIFDNSFTATDCYNTHAPVLDGTGLVTVQQRESVDVSTVIYSVSATDADSPLRAGDIAFSLRDVTIEGTLEIGPQSGNISIASSLDREQYNEIRATVVATDQGPHVSTRLSDTLELILQVVDVNDNPPITEESFYSIAVSEAEESVIFQFSGSDDDVDSRNRGISDVIITYNGSDTENIFRVDTTTDPNEQTFAASLVLVGSLDYESRVFYNLSLEIFDNGDPAQSSELTIELNVTDENDNRPVFASPESIVTIENNEVGVPVLEIKADDADSGANAEFYFEINSVHEADNDGVRLSETPLIGYFYLQTDESTGQTTLRANRTFDREGMHSFILTITAREEGIESGIPVLFLWVMVCEQNDHIPTFSGPVSGSVDENSEVDTFLMTIKVTDLDAGPFCQRDTVEIDNSQDNVVEYTLLNADEVPFIVDRESGNVSVNGSIDFEKNQMYVLEVEAYDLGIPSLSSTANITVSIVDLNDNPPVLNSESYVTTAFENSSLNTPLMVTIGATDLDSGENKVIEFNLTGEGSSDFSIDDTGVIRVVMELDRDERQQFYSLTVIAYNPNDPSLNDTAPLNITVLDINDTPPVFDQPSYFGKISENAEAETLILSVFATDADRDSRKITYRLETTSELFAVDNDTGVVYVLGSLCVYENTTFTFSVVAEDRPVDIVLFISTVNVSVLVYDDNANVPVFDREYGGIVADGVQSGEPILTVSATDGDNCSPPFKYYIADQPTGNLFQIDDDTGTLYTNAVLNQEDGDFYTLSISAMDTGTPNPQTGFTTVYVVVGETVPVNIDVEGGFPVSSPRAAATDFTYEQTYNYLYDTYIGSTGTFTASYREFSSSENFQTDPLPATKVVAKILTPTVYHNNRLVQAAVQALDTFNSYNLRDTLVNMSVTYEGSVVYTTGTTTLNGGSTALLTLTLPEAWFYSSDNESVEATVAFGVGEQQQYITDSINLIPAPDYYDLCSSYTTQPQVQMRVPAYTVYKEQVFDIPIYADRENGAMLTALSMRCELDTGLRFYNYPFTDDLTSFLAIYWFENYTSRDVLEFTATRVEPFQSPPPSRDYVGSLLVEVTDSSATQAGITCTKYEAVSYNENEDPFSDLLVVDRWGCHDNNRGDVTISKDKLTAVFPSMQQTVIFNDVVFTGARREVDVVLYGYVLSAEPYPIVIREQVDVVCSSTNRDALQTMCSQGIYEVYINGSETEGAPSVEISFMASSVAEGFDDFELDESLFPVSTYARVWFPDMTLVLRVEDETLNAVDGWQRSEQNDCVQGYQTTRLEANVNFRLQSNSLNFVIARVEGLLTLQSSNEEIITLSGVKVVGQAPGNARIVALSHDGREIDSIDISVVDTEVHAVEVEIFHGKAVDTIVPSSVPYEGSDPFQVNLNPGLRYETETAELASSILFSDGMRYWVSDLVEYSPDNSSIFELDGSMISASESGEGHVQVDWESCDGNLVISRPVPFSLDLITPEVRITLEENEIALQNDSASLLDSFPIVTYLTVLLVYDVDGETVTVDVTENSRTYVSFSPQSSVSVAVINGRYKIEPVSPKTRVSIQAFYRSYNMSAVETLTIVEASEVTLAARPYPIYDGAPEIDTLKLIGNTGSFQMAKLDAILYVNVPEENRRTYDISTSPHTVYNIRVGSPVSTRDAIFTPRSVGEREVQTEFGSLTSNTITLNAITSEEVTVSSIDRLELSTGETLSGEQNTIAAQLSIALTFSDGSKFEDAYINGRQVIPALFTVVFADSSVASITVLNGDITLLGNAPSTTSLTVIINDRTGLQETIDFYANLEPSVDELDLGLPTGTPVSPVSLGDSFSVPLFINTGSTNIGAIEIGVAYSSSLLSLDSVTSGSDWPEEELVAGLNYFGSSENQFEGFVHFGGVIIEERSGLLHIADLNFTARELSGVANIKAEIITYLDFNVPPEPIPHPQESPAANIHVVVGTPSDLTEPDLSIPLEYLESDTTACTGPLPCECDNGKETGDINGDCVFNFLDVVSLYHDSSLYLSLEDDQNWEENPLECHPENNADFNIDGVCTVGDVTFLLQASFWQAHFVPRLNIIPVNRNDCFLTIEADLISRGDRPANGERTSLLIALYDRDPAADTQYDETTNFLGLGSKVSTTAPADGIIPASLNGGVFLASASDLVEGRFEVKLETEFVSSQLGLMLIQVHSGYENQPSDAGIIHMRRYNFPPVFPEAVRANIHHPLTDILLEWAIASPLRTINQTVASSNCINNDKPQFFPEITEVEVYENAAIGTLVATIFANDTDSERNTIITYSIGRIVPNDAEFYINESSGEVFLNSSLNREGTSRYMILVHAEDQGNFGSLGGDGELIVNVLDINDNDPEFTQSVYNAMPVPEDVDIGSIVITVEANDMDVNNTIEYSLQNPQKFSIDPNTGEITVESELDYENQPTYELLVVATDQGGRTGNATVVIEVEPLNDNEPICGEFHTVVPEDTHVGTSFYTVTVSDADVGSIHRDLTFTLLSFTSEFSINKTGETTVEILTATNNLIFDGETSYDLMIVARDIDNQNCTSMVRVTVGESAAFIFDISGAGFAIGSPTRLADSGGYEQKIAMFGNSLPEGTVSVILGGTTQSASYNRNTPPVSTLAGILTTPELKYDSPFIKVIAQAKDNTFNTIAGAQISLRATLSNGVIITGGESETVGGSGSCLVNIEVPQSWFGDSESTVQVWLESEGIEEQIQNVTLQPRPRFSFSYLQNLIVQYPSFDLFPGQNFYIKVGAFTGNDIIAFELNTELDPEFTALGFTTAQWECLSGSTGTSFTCLRGSSQEDLPEDSTFPGEKFLELEVAVAQTVLSPTDFMIPTTIKTVVSRFGPEVSSGTPATLIDQRGVTESPAALLTVSLETSLGYLPFAEQGEVIIVHNGFVDLQASAVKVTQNTADVVSLALPEFECEYDSTTSDCSDLLSHFSEMTSGGSEETSILITDTTISHSFSLSLRVWYPVSVRSEVSDYNLNLIEGCTAEYQKTSLRVLAQYTTGERTSPVLDVTRFNVPLDYDNTIININGGTVSGVNTGSTSITVTAAPGVVSTGQTIFVVIEVIRPLVSYPVVFTRLDLSLSQNTFERTSSIVATASTRQIFDAVDTEGETATVVYFTDGSRYDPTTDEVMTTSTDSSVVTATPEGTVTAVGSGETTVSVQWAIQTCLSPQISAPANVEVQLPYPVQLVVNSPVRILGNSREVPITSVPTTATFEFSLIYSDGSSTTVDDLENIQSLVPPLLNVVHASDSITVSASDTSTASTATVDFWYDSLTASAEVVIVSVEQLQTSLLPYPNETSLEEGLSHIDLEQLGSTGYWQQAELVVVAVFSDGTVERIDNPRVMNAGTDGNVHVILDLNNRIIRRIEGSFGTNLIVASSGQLQSSNNVTVSHLDQVAAVDRVELSVDRIDHTQYQYSASVYFDGTLIDDVTEFSRDIIGENLLTFSLSPSDVGAIDTSTAIITIVKSHYDLITLTASLGGATARESFPANLEPEIGEIDLGAPDDVPIPPVSLGDTFSVDVRVNTNGNAILVLDAIITYNQTALELVSVESHIGFSSVRSNEPVGEVQLTAIGSGNLEQDTTIPIVATVTFRTLAEGLVSIGGYRKTLIGTAGLSYTSEESTSVIVQVGASQTILHTHIGPIQSDIQFEMADIDDSGSVDIVDAYEAFLQLSNGVTTEDTNWDEQYNVRDVVYLTRISTSLAPILLNLPTITQPASESDCNLIFKQSFFSSARVQVFAIITHPDIAAELNVSLTGENSLISLYNSGSGVFTTQESNPNTFTLELYTPLDIRVSPIGYSLVVQTLDDLGSTSPERRVQFIGGATSTRVGENELIPRLDAPVLIGENTGSPVLIGENAGFTPLDTFMIDGLRSDYCSFDGSIIELSVFETHTMGSVIWSVSAVRDDLGFPSRGEQYTITYESADGAFDITSNGSLYITSSLDYEEQQNYTLDVEGETLYGDASTATFTARINIAIVDVNDEAPMLTLSSVTNELFENEAVGLVVAQFLASDREAGTNGEVYFELDSTSDPLNQFRLDQNGDMAKLILDKSLDRENISMYNITVFAFDRGDPPLSSSETVPIIVLDINDNPPVFDQTSYTISVPEETVDWSYTINVIDPDIGTNGEITLMLVDAPEFSINNDGVVGLSESLDRETTDSYEFTVMAVDTGAEQMESSANIMITVIDINDNAPVLTLGHPVQPILLEDDLPNGTFIAQFEANDKDIGRNAELSFWISEAHIPFQIDPNLGILTLQGTLDVNQQSRYDITVMVEDGGTQTLTDSYSLVVYAIEGQSVSFDAGQEGYLIGTYTKPEEGLYEQPLGFLIGQNIGTPVRLRGDVNIETVAEDVIQIPNFGGTAAYIRGALLQTSVAYSLKKVVAFVQAFDSRDVIAGPTLVRVRIFSNISSVPLEGSCTTSPDLGYCIASVTAPDLWFAEPAYITAVYANFLSMEEDGVLIGSADIIASPLSTHNFNSEQVLLIPPAHPVLASRTFTAELYAISPYLYEAYNRIDFTVGTNGAIFTAVSSDNTWDCSKSSQNQKKI